MKKTLVLTVDYPPMGGGMARHCADVCIALKQAGRPPIVVAPSAEEGAGEAAADIQVCRLKRIRAGRVFDNYAMGVLSFFLGGIRHCIPGNVTFVMANTWSMAGVAAYLINRTTGIPYVIFSHGLDVYSALSSPRAVKLMKAVLENAAVVIANSHFTKGLVERSAGRANVAVLNPMVDPKRFAAHLPGDAGPGGRPREILTVGRLVESKGHDLIIRAMPKILERFPDAVYRIVGCGPREDALKALSKECAVSEHTIFEGAVQDPALAAYYRKCDIFAMTSREIPERGEAEGFGIVFLEAGLFAKPVVGSRSGGIPDAVEDGVTGILVDPADTDGVAAAIIRLFSEPDLAKSMGQAGLIRARNGFGPDLFSVRLKEIVEGTFQRWR